MKNIFLTIAKNSAVTATFVMLMAAPFQPLVVLAQSEINAQLGGGATDSRSLPAEVGPTPAQAGLQLNSSGTGVIGANQSGSLPTSNCALGSGGSLFSGGDWAQCVTDIVYVFTVGIGSGFAYVAAYFFDWAVALSLNGSAYALDFISQGWATARDIANMAFLFILLYIAFKIMFQAETNETVHMLTLVIVVALLVNFSFFFTRLVIDAGNILSIQFYNAIDVPSVGSTAQGSGVQSTVASVSGITGSSFSNSKDLTYSIMGMLNLQGLLGNDSFKAWRDSAGYGFLSALITLSFLYIAAGIMLWLLTVMLITNGVKFLFRIVVLWFLIIASPLAFVARAVPKFEKYYKDWQDALIKHAFYPAAFMFIFLILTNFAKQMGQNNALINGIFNGLQNTGGQTSAVASIGYAVANVGIRMGFVIAMLYIGMEASKRIGVLGADAANHAGNWVGGKLIGTYGTVGRNTLGYAGNRLANTAALRTLEARPGVAGLFGRGLRTTLGTVGRASFDARGVPGTKSVLKDTGKAQKGGYESALKERVEAKEKRMKAVEPSDAQKAQARATAEKETGYAEHAIKFNDAKTKRDAADARLQALIESGKENSDEAKQALAEKEKHNSDMITPGTRMKILEGITQKRAKEISGEGLKNEYATTLSTPNLRNLWIPFRSSKEAAAKVRKGDSNEKKVLDAAKKALKEAEEEKTGEAEAQTETAKKETEDKSGGH